MVIDGKSVVARAQGFESLTALMHIRTVSKGYDEPKQIKAAAWKADTRRYAIRTDG